MCCLDRRVFLVDFENVNVLAFTGITALSEYDEVIVLYTKACVKGPKTLEQFYLKTKATLTMMFAENGHKNALDFQLSSLLGKLSSEEKFKTKYYIIANDKGYDCLSIFLQRFGVDVTRKESIFTAVNSLPDPIATAQVEGEEDQAQTDEFLEELLSSENALEPEEEDAGGEASGEKKKDKKEKEKKDKKGKKEKKEDKERGEKKSRGKKKEPTILLVGPATPFKEGDSLIPIVPLEEPGVVPAPVIQKSAPAEVQPEPASKESADAPAELSVENAFIVQAIRERFFGNMEQYADVAVDAYLYSVGHPEEGKTKMDTAHHYLVQTLRSSVKVKKIYTLLKPYLK